ncbi:MAG: hypothetical protein GWQ05_22475 [Verrucomicrobiaceae bacterium]|nr:hypothetical protein [Verrucomicrobiaceae bacterium]
MIKSINALKVELFHKSNDSEVSRVWLAALSPQKLDLLNHSQLKISIFIQSDELRLRVGKNQVSVPLPFPIPQDDVNPDNLGVAGQLISPSLFLLIKHPGCSITATMTESRDRRLMGNIHALLAALTRNKGRSVKFAGWRAAEISTMRNPC